MLLVKLILSQTRWTSLFMHNLHIAGARAHILIVFLVSLFYVFASTPPHPRIGSDGGRVCAGYAE